MVSIYHTERVDSDLRMKQCIVKMDSFQPRDKKTIPLMELYFKQLQQSWLETFDCKIFGGFPPLVLTHVVFTKFYIQIANSVKIVEVFVSFWLLFLTYQLLFFLVYIWYLCFTSINSIINQQHVRIIQQYHVMQTAKYYPRCMLLTDC